MTPTPKIKRCSLCSEDLPLSAFRVRPTSQPRAYCVPCWNSSANRLRDEASSTAHGYIAYALPAIKYRSLKKKGVPFSLTVDSLVHQYHRQYGRCALSGIILTHDRRGALPTNISVDRVDPEGPYSPDNIQLVCAEVNIMRRSLPLEEFLTWTRLIADTNSSSSPPTSKRRKRSRPKSK